jgi:hypothetical protein
MYVLLTGTKKNAGDFLIAQAAKRLISHFAPDKEFVELPSWLPFDERLEEVNASRAIILGGGPAFQYGLGTTIYPFAKNLKSIRVPIISLGLGWKGIPGDDFDVRNYPFPDHAAPILERLRSDHPYVSCRDWLTCRMLKTHAIENTLMTGCPAMYDPAYFGLEPSLPVDPSDIVFTPAERTGFRDQSVRMIESVRSFFPDSRIVVSFHRGWDPDTFTSPDQAANARAIKEAAERMGLESRDISGSVSGLDEYRNYDLHVGYRVHGHYKFLSMRKPSFLIAEDGRGRGALEATGSPGVSAWRTPPSFLMAQRWISNPTFLRRIRGRVGSFLVNPDAPEEMQAILSEEIEGGYPRCRGAFATIEATWSNMLRMVKSLPSA